MQTAATVTRALERVAATTARRQRLRVEWHEGLGQGLHAAYAAVGGEEWVPAALLIRVLATPGPHRKRVAVVYRDESPCAVVPLREAGRFWEPLLQGVIPEINAFPCVSHQEEVLASLNLNIGCWASLEPPSGNRNLRWAEPKPCYELNVHEDPEPYWRSRNLWKTIVQARNRTSAFELVVDDAGACSWGIEQWRDRFYTGANDQVSSKWNDRVTVANWALANDWRMHSWHLRDRERDRWVAGVTGFVHDGRLSFGTLFRHPEYDWHGVGHRCFYEVFLWARSQGLKTVSLGADWEYKRRWAPPVGTQWDFVVSPLPVHAWNAVVKLKDRALSAGRRG